MKMTDERKTPKELFDKLNAEFKFEIDVCAMRDNAQLPNYYHIGQNGLAQVWHPKRCFMNPPFSEIPQWLRKAKAESELGALVVAILPNDSSTKWFHEYIWDRDIEKFRLRVIFPTKRYSFGNYANVSKFSVLIAVFDK